MNKEPIGLYIFRFITGFALFAFMCLLYWSSVLIEESLRDVKLQLASVKSDIFSLTQQTNDLKGELLRSLAEQPESSTTGQQRLPYKESERPHIIADLPNLLQEDPFYQTTLPALLPQDFSPYGTRKNASLGIPDDLHPFNNFSHILEWWGMCSLSVARLKTGIYETFAPNFAIKIEERTRKDLPVPEYWIHLREGVFWQPLTEAMFAGRVRLSPWFQKKHPVTAKDIKFYYDVVMNPYVQKPGAVALRNYLEGIEEIDVIDDLTLVVRWKAKKIDGDNGEEASYKIPYVAKLLTGSLSPLASFVYQHFPDGSKIIDDEGDPEQYRTNSVFAQNFHEHFAKNIIPSCGPWVFELMSDQEIRFNRNADHFFPLDCLALKSLFTFKNSPDNIWQQFKNNQLDNYILVPDQLGEMKSFLSSNLYKGQAEKGFAINSIEYFDRAYSYIGWNNVRPYFSNPRLRLAMTLAIDRTRIITQYLSGMGLPLTGPFSPFSPSYDAQIQPWPYNPDLAKAILEEEGWIDTDGDGVADKEIGGRRVPFAFQLTYYVKNPTTKAICEYVATALKEIGVKCLLNGVDVADISARFDDKNFDALCMAWGLSSPPEDPRQLWHSAGAKEPGSSNAVGFANKEADEIIDQLTFEDDHEKRLALYHRFHQIIHQEQPYTFLYVPKRILLYREYLQNVFIPGDRQELIPGANIFEPLPPIFWIKKH